MPLRAKPSRDDVFWSINMVLNREEQVILQGETPDWMDTSLGARRARAYQSIDKVYFHKRLNHFRFELRRAYRMGVSAADLSDFFNPKDLIWKALFKATTGSGISHWESATLMERVLPGLEVQTFSGAEWRVKSPTRMTEESNYSLDPTRESSVRRQQERFEKYPHLRRIERPLEKIPPLFNHADYVKLVQFLLSSYRETDPDWCQILIRNIYDELRNYKIKWFLLRKDAELIAVAKVKQTGERCFYFGTQYVDPSMQGGHGMGRFVENVLVESSSRSIGARPPIFQCTVSMMNPALSRHIYRSGYSGIGITEESRGDWTSHPLLFLQRDEEKQTHAVEPWEIPNILNGRQECTKDGILYGFAENAPGRGPFLEAMQSRLVNSSENVELTRVHFDRDDDGNYDPSIVFFALEELPKTEIKTIFRWGAKYDGMGAP